jgi:hypothetical protein
MVNIFQINEVVNRGRESLLSFLSNAPEELHVKSILWIVMALMAVIVFINFRKGSDERKNIAGPIAIMVFCLSLLFGFNILAIAWLLIFVLGSVLIKRLVQGEWKGVLLMLVPIYFLSFIVAVKPYLLLILIVLFSVLGFFVERADFHKIFGTGAAARALRDQGFPVNKERRVLKWLLRTANKGYGWSKDVMLRSASKLKQRFAERALRNEAEQLREAEMVAASEAAAKALYSQEKELSELEARDSVSIENVLRCCSQLRNYLNSLSGSALDEAKSFFIRNETHKILEQLHALVRQKLEEETLIAKAGKAVKFCMDIISQSAHEAVQLEEHRSDFRELKAASTANINAMRRQINHETAELTHIIRTEQGSRAEGSAERINLMKQRVSGLSDVSARLSNVERFMLKIDNMLIGINSREAERISSVKSMGNKARAHSKTLQHYENLFDREANKLEKIYKQFSVLSNKETLPDAQLLTITNNTIDMFTHIRELNRIAWEYHEKELLPLVRELAEMDNDLSHLAKVSEALNKLYFRLSQANELLTKMAITVDQNPEARAKLGQIDKTEEFEKQLTKLAYRKGLAVVSHISGGYRYLQSVYGYVGRQTELLKNFFNLTVTAQKQVAVTLNSAFKTMLNREIKQTHILEEEAAQAERVEKAGLAAERSARGFT